MYGNSYMYIHAGFHAEICILLKFARVVKSTFEHMFKAHCCSTLRFAMPEMSTVVTFHIYECTYIQCSYDVAITLMGFLMSGFSYLKEKHWRWLGQNQQLMMNIHM